MQKGGRESLFLLSAWLMEEEEKDNWRGRETYGERDHKMGISKERKKERLRYDRRHQRRESEEDIYGYSFC